MTVGPCRVWAGIWKVSTHSLPTKLFLLSRKLSLSKKPLKSKISLLTNTPSRSMCWHSRNTVRIWPQHPPTRVSTLDLLPDGSRKAVKRDLIPIHIQTPPPSCTAKKGREHAKRTTLEETGPERPSTCQRAFIPGGFFWARRSHHSEFLVWCSLDDPGRRPCAAQFPSPTSSGRRITHGTAVFTELPSLSCAGDPDCTSLNFQPLWIGNSEKHKAKISESRVTKWKSKSKP